MRGRRWLIVAALLVGSVFGPSGAGAARGPELAALRDAQRLLHELRVEEAAAVLAPFEKNSGPEFELVRGSLAFHQGDYEGAARRLRGALSAVRLPAAEAQELRSLVELATATAELTRGFVEQKSPGGHFLIRYRPGPDEVLFPYAADALEQAYAALASDFSGIGDATAARPAAPVRVEIYGEIADLAKVSTLTLKEIETSGTIALCKWNRLMIVSPRALLRGYPWLDTLTHEYTHLIVSRVSRNAAPIWIQEGLAKFEEKRWRGSGAGGLSPSLEHMLAQAAQKKRLISFEQMSPSMAKLPSQEDTALAFAEVYTAIEYLHGRLGFAGLRTMLRELSQGATDQRAVATAYGASFAEFERGWKSYLRGRRGRGKTSAAVFAGALRFRRGPASAATKVQPEDDESGELADPKARAFMRLGGLLYARGRLLPAAIEYEKAQGSVGPSHPILALRLSRTYLELGDAERAVAVLEPARELYADLAGINAALGAAWLRRGDLPKAAQYLEAAIATSPFDPAVHCGLGQIYQKLKNPLEARADTACRLLIGRR